MTHTLIHWTVVGSVGYATVQSGNSGRFYTVTATHDHETCSCEAGKRRFGCSHVRSVREELHRRLLASQPGAEVTAPASSETPTPVRASAPSVLEQIDAIKARVRSGEGIRSYEDAALLVDRIDEIELAWARLREAWLQHLDTCPKVAEDRAEGEKAFDRIRRAR